MFSKYDLRIELLKLNNYNYELTNLNTSYGQHLLKIKYEIRYIPALGNITQAIKYFLATFKRAATFTCSVIKDSSAGCQRYYRLLCRLSALL